MKAVSSLLIACVLGFFWAHVAEYVAVNYYDFPAADPTKISATDVAFWTFVGTSLFLFGMLQTFGSDSR